MTPRTLRNWKKLDPAEEVPPPGRPRTSAAVLEEAKDLVRVELERQGWAAGEEPVWRALGGRVPRARVRRVLAVLKAEHRARCRSRAAEVRVSARVHAPDALWSMDATHLGRDAHRHAIQAEVIRDVASTRTIGIAVGKAAEAEDVVALLERTAAERGCAPLVLVTDNGAPYRSDAVASWCARHGVLQLFSQPRTPQHNPWAEHGMRELKEDAALGKGSLVLDIEEAHERLVRSRDRLDGQRLRASRAWRTAVEADEAMPHWSALVSRETLRKKVSCRIQATLLDYQGERARRRAIREAILDALAGLSVITRTRGGRPWTAQDAEDDS